MVTFSIDRWISAVSKDPNFKIPSNSKGLTFTLKNYQAPLFKSTELEKSLRNRRVKLISKLYEAVMYDIDIDLIIEDLHSSLIYPITKVCNFFGFDLNIFPELITTEEFESIREIISDQMNICISTLRDQYFEGECLILYNEFLAQWHIQYFSVAFYDNRNWEYRDTKNIIDNILNCIKYKWKN